MLACCRTVAPLELHAQKRTTCACRWVHVSTCRRQRTPRRCLVKEEREQHQKTHTKLVASCLNPVIEKFVSWEGSQPRCHLSESYASNDAVRGRVYEAAQSQVRGIKAAWSAPDLQGCTWPACICEQGVSTPCCKLQADQSRYLATYFQIASSL